MFACRACLETKVLQVKEQMICALWNFSMDEKHRINISNTDLLPMLINSADDEDLKVQQAAGCALANLALSPSNHQVMVEAGVIPKLVRIYFSLVYSSRKLFFWLLIWRNSKFNTFFFVAKKSLEIRYRIEVTNPFAGDFRLPLSMLILRLRIDCGFVWPILK